MHSFFQSISPRLKSPPSQRWAPFDVGTVGEFIVGELCKIKVKICPRLPVILRKWQILVVCSVYYIIV